MLSYNRRQRVYIWHQHQCYTLSNSRRYSFMCQHTFIFFIHSLDLSPPSINVTPKGNPMAGETYSLECSVETKKGVRSTNISITWTTPNGAIVKTGNLMTNGTVTKGTLAFSPLNTSHSGEYICTGRISAESVGVNVSNNFSIVVNVSSKSIYTLLSNQPSF